MGMGLIPGFLWLLMMETLEGIDDIGKHEEVHCVVAVVPIQIQSQVVFSLPVAGDGVVLREDDHDMVSILFANVSHFKIIHA